MFAEIPFETESKDELERICAATVLTGDVRAGFELGGHLRIHGDHDLLLLRHERVPLLDLLGDPLLEVLAHDGGADVQDPLLRDLRQVGLVGQVQVDLRVLAHEGEDLLERQVLVLRHVDVLDGVVVQVRLLPLHDVLEEVDRRVVCKKKEIREDMEPYLP